MNAIEVEHVSHRVQPSPWHRSKLILDDVSFQVPQGQVVGFLGPNGAGKTTTIRALLGLYRPEQGRCLLFGHPSHEPRARRPLGYLPERVDLPEQLTPMQLLRWHGQLTGQDRKTSQARAQACLELIQMTHHAKIPCRHLSKGQLQRVGLAQALMGHPTLLILDEPMSGLDPIGRHELRQLIEHLHQEGTTIFFSTHVLADADMLCDTVVVLHRGKVQAVGPLAHILPLHSERVEIQIPHVPEHLRQTIGQMAHELRQTGGQLRIALPSQAVALQILDLLRAAQVPVLSMQPMRADIEGLFVHLLQQPATSPHAEPPRAN